MAISAVIDAANKNEFVSRFHSETDTNLWPWVADRSIFNRLFVSGNQTDTRFSYRN